jgi:hypothetical protein
MTFIPRAASSLSCVLALAALGACAGKPSPEPEPEIRVEPVKNVGIAPADQPVAPGDCAEALRRALAKPDLEVDRIPSPLVAKPAALQRPPRSALNRDGSAEIKVDVLIDTMGKADMRTFTVVKSSNKWLTNNVRGVLPKWTFAPAQLAGCKVPRIYHFMASAPARKK